MSKGDTLKTNRIKEKDRHRIDYLHEYGIDIDYHMIYLQGVEDEPTEEFDEPGVEYRMANRFIKNLDILAGIDADKPIVVSMKTNGGYVTEGLAMYDAILATPNPVIIVNYTHARSMSSMILQAANKRVMMPHSFFMYHMGTEGGYGTTKQARSEMYWNKRGDRAMLDIYVEAIKRTPHSTMYHWSEEEIEKFLIGQMDKYEDVYLDAVETIDAGFADEIFSTWESVTDLSPEQLKRKDA